ncbi:hypothetical protein GGF46_005488 [Coemansia sp. RSA 552]|nr:hypothetical protein GGF46_005488 [Coemansia sp. RSA 552]
MDEIYTHAKDARPSSSISCEIPPEPVAAQKREVVLSWDNLVYKVPTGSKDKELRTILHGISGEARAGETIAIIGSSGAGKTTLLNALSGRIVGGRLTGDIQYRGARRYPSSFKRIAAYVQQDDLMHSLLTVHETLTYTSWLRLPSSQYSPQEKAERVEAAIQQLRLEPSRNTQIGSEETRGVSGGERKRVSIGSELLADPRLLFLDEPTSGLDSNSSELVVELVKGIAAERSIAALMTIHQPNAHIFNTFDKVILLSQGRIVYFGPTSSSIDYFSSIGYQCPMHENPADYFVGIMTLDYRSPQALAKSKVRITGLADAFEKHAEVEPVNSKEPAGDSDQSMVDSGPSGKLDLARNTWLYEYSVLARRDWISIFRNTEYWSSQIGQPLVMGLLVGFMFYYLGHDALSIQNRLGVVLVIIMQASFPIVYPPLVLFEKQLSILDRERSVASYRLTAYYASKSTLFMPMSLVCNSIFYIGVYFISRLTIDAAKFFTGLGVFYMLNTTYISLALLFATAVRPVEVAFVISSAYITLHMLFCGFLANFHNVTPVLRWIRWTNPVYFAFAAMAQNELQGMKFTCDAGAQCFETGEQVLSYYSLDRFTVGQNVLLLMLVGALYYIGGYVFLRWKAKPRYIWI